jgi:hypothetical protein
LQVVFESIVWSFYRSHQHYRVTLLGRESAQDVFETPVCHRLLLTHDAIKGVDGHHRSHLSLAAQ